MPVIFRNRQDGGGIRLRGNGKDRKRGKEDMQKFIKNLEKKFGRYAIPDLINYFIIFYVASTIISLFMPWLYYSFLALDFRKIMHGQIWRLFTFILAPENLLSRGHSVETGLNIFFFIITVHLYYLFGRSLENIWGSFRFNLYFIGGIVLTVLAELILFITTGQSVYYGGMNYIYQSMFFAFCVLFPEERFLIYFVFPVKAKVLAIIDGILLAVMFIQYLAAGDFGRALALVVAMLNFLIFFYVYKGLDRYSPRQVKRRKEFKRQTMRPQGVTKHQCAICGRNEVTNPELSFRFCSKCNGNYEYCEEHLFTHQHVR